MHRRHFQGAVWVCGLRQKFRVLRLSLRQGCLLPSFRFRDSRLRIWQVEPFLSTFHQTQDLLVTVDAGKTVEKGTPTSCRRYNVHRRVTHKKNRHSTGVAEGSTGKVVVAETQSVLHRPENRGASAWRVALLDPARFCCD